MGEELVTEDIFIWDGCKSKDIDKYILGGEDIILKTSEELLISNNKKTKEVIKVNCIKRIIYISSILLPFLINSYSIIVRWINRPERDPAEFHNWSKLSLIHVEFAGLTYYLSNFVSNILYLLMCYLINNSYKLNKPHINEKKLECCSMMTCYLTAVPLLIFSLWKVYEIIIEECGFFIKHIEDINNNTTQIYNNTKFGELNYIPFLTLGILMFLRKIFRNIGHYNRYTKYIKDKEYDGNYTIYDPRALKGLNYNIQSIGGFSLLKVIVWTKHKLPIIIKEILCVFKEGCDEQEEETDIFCKICCKGCMCFTYLFAISFVMPLLIILGVIFGVSFLSLIVKVSQVSFVGELEILDWKYENYIQFIAFLNNILSLDTGKSESFDSIMTFLFSGEDAEEDEDEKIARKRLINGIINFSINYQGLLDTLIALPQIGTAQLQHIFIYKKEELIPREAP